MSKKSNVSAGPASPIIDVEGLSDEEQEKEKSKRKKDGANVFKEPSPDKLLSGTLSSSVSSVSNSVLEETADSKVFTLAEQFLAAMPERIKNESDSEPMVLGGCSSPHPSTSGAGNNAGGADASQSDDLGCARF